VAVANAAPRPWLVSPRFDLGLVIGPALLAVIAAFLVPDDAALGLLGWLAIVVFIDVAHVWASLYRVYLDPAERGRRPALYLGAPIAAMVGASLLHSASPGWFWTVLAYLAVFHFVRQQIGFVALYRMREGLPTRSRDAMVERGAIYAVTLWPVLWWHAHLPRRFDWFLAGDFLPGVPPSIVAPAGGVAAAVVALHVALRVRSRRFAPGRDLWMALTAACWLGGTVLTNGDVAFTLSNVVLHGVPYIALVGWVGRRTWDVHGDGPARRGWFHGVGLLLFVGLLLALALAEEGLWDVLVWHDQAALFGAWEIPGWAPALAVPLLATPQITHYVLDAFIWKVPSNPRLASVLSAG